MVVFNIHKYTFYSNMAHNFPFADPNVNMYVFYLNFFPSCIMEQIELKSRHTQGTGSPEETAERDKSETVDKMQSKFKLVFN